MHTPTIGPLTPRLHCSHADWPRTLFRPIRMLATQALRSRTDSGQCIPHAHQICTHEFDCHAKKLSMKNPVPRECMCMRKNISHPSVFSIGTQLDIAQRRLCDSRLARAHINVANVQTFIAYTRLAQRTLTHCRRVLQLTNFTH